MVDSEHTSQKTRPLLRNVSYDLALPPDVKTGVERVRVRMCVRVCAHIHIHI